MTTTCQICARAIKANTGTVAHHGYTRPHGEGWQSSSCFGAKWRPYEVACDALPPAIKSAELYKIGQETALARWLAEPPETITYQREDAYGPRGPLHTFKRPDGFDPSTARTSYMMITYEWQYQDRQRAYERRIKQVTADIAALKKRLAEWKAPQ